MPAKLAGLSPGRLRLWLALFFAALALPTGLLVHQAYSRLKWEAVHQHRVLAEELAERLRARTAERIAIEEARAFADYSFLVAAGDPAANYLQRSPLSEFPVSSALPGVIGHFQVDSEGSFSTPLLPAADAGSYGVTATELRQRQEIAQQLRAVLSRNRLVRAAEGESGARRLDRAAGAPPAEHDSGLAQSGSSAATSAPPASISPPPRSASPLSAEPQSALQPAPPSAPPPEAEPVGQAVFDQLNRSLLGSREAKEQQAPSTLGRVDDLKLEKGFEPERSEETRREARVQKGDETAARRMRKEISALPEQTQVPTATAAHQARAPATLSDLRIRTFESEIDPFEFSRLQSGHFVLYRKVWRGGQRIIQGLLIEQRAFLDGLVANGFHATALSRMSDLVVAYRGDVLQVYRGDSDPEYFSRTPELRGDLLYHVRFDAPLADLELIFSIRQLPPGPGAGLITWVAVVLGMVVCVGLLLMYRLGLGQIRLARQQQDFVSAVSHELKTPLTSIRMYAEMLREGWASEDKKREYYHFILDESERLSRLINNVLQLARLTRNDLKVNAKPRSAAELMDLVRSKITTQVERAHFTLNLHCPAEAAGLVVEVDLDYFTQILINLVDNALKFSAKAEKRAVDVGCRSVDGQSVTFTVRDYGPGIAKGQMQKIFELFYRSENELTRETVGTGIGLALVRQLAAAMNGRVDVLNVGPGAEFRVRFPQCR